MQVALEVSFYNIDEDADAADEIIRAHVGQLEETYDRISSCRVRVAKRAANDNRVRLPAVLIELAVPGRKLVISHEADGSQIGGRADVGDAIRTAFRKAERALRDLQRIRETNERIAAAGDLSFLGQITEVYPLQDYGYLIDKNGERLYFHRDAIVEGDFDYLVCGAEALYVEKKSPTGTFASKVWVREAQD